MRRTWGLIAGIAALVASGACAQVPDIWPVEDDGVFIPGSMEKVGEGYNFTEGPVWDGARVIFSDISGDTVYMMIPGETPRVLYTPSFRANGHTFDRNGALLNAEHGSGELTRWTPEGGRVTVVAAYQGKHLNSPNDVVVRSDGLILFTDPPYGLNSAYNGVQRAAEVGFNGVFAFDEASGRMVLIDDALGRPNGIALSPNEATLYVSDSASNKVWAYTLAAAGSASEKRLLADLAIEGKPFPVDGLRVDSEGRVFATCPAGVCVIAPDGTRVATLELPIRASNVGWARPGLSDLYITSGTEVWKVSTRARGIGSSIKP
ncbi:MAG: SMP-30/gluconolactonase/LRE family protein [Porphyrobacter sp.]|nr:SMP-30/gluconolactonase/LRE family protein [Porphyrobacter sp.]